MKNPYAVFAFVILPAATLVALALHAHGQAPLSDPDRITALELRLAKIESLVFPQISATQVSSPAVFAGPPPTGPHLRTLKVDSAPYPQEWSTNGILVISNGVLPSPRITPKSKFIDDCPYCGVSNILSTTTSTAGGSTVSNADVPIGTKLEWNISWKCPHCEGQWSDTKTSFIPKRNSRLSKDALTP